MVDQQRQQVPISATQIRERPELGQRFLSPVVHASFVRRVCVLGGESSGKTTLARALAQRFATTCADEYGRELWLERGGALEYDDFLTIASTQVAREELAARGASSVTFGDTSPLTTLFYCQHEFGRAEPELQRLAERSYDLTLLCAPDFPFVQDGTRRDAGFRAEQHAFYVRELGYRRTPWLLLEGPLEARIALASSALRG
jgi:NadR type nicotinamide-nucleotide adenylyltransferase